MDYDPDKWDSPEDDNRFHFNNEAFTLSQAYGPQLALDVEDWYKVPMKEPVDAGDPFDSDDEYSEISYRQGGKEISCSAQQLLHGLVSDMREDKATGQVCFGCCSYRRLSATWC